MKTVYWLVNQYFLTTMNRGIWRGKIALIKASSRLKNREHVGVLSGNWLISSIFITSKKQEVIASGITPKIYGISCSESWSRMLLLATLLYGYTFSSNHYNIWYPKVMQWHSLVKLGIVAMAAIWCIFDLFERNFSISKYDCFWVMLLKAVLWGIYHICNSLWPKEKLID